MTEQRVTIPEAARILDVSVRILNARADAKRLPFESKDGQRWVTLTAAANCLPAWTEQQRRARAADK